jgi:uncharacterized protein YyaL (SSP411 family)
MTANLLSQETSPYLLQHQHNPVHWRPWNEDALAEARKQNKPILLSVGYAACHWCHVMAHESFEDPQIADTMNQLFINIKVDREERPDIDSLYQSALALTGQQGGWPLTMFLTPDGEPFFGGTYFPPTPRYGRPAFPDLLVGVSNAFTAEPEKVSQNVVALRNALARLANPQSGAGITPAVMDQAAATALRLVDPIHGGTVGAPKFPQPVFFRFLWQSYKRTASEPYRDAVISTLTSICQGGIYDHLGGGFARYSTDDRWLAPHFEKMLYDNALLIDLLTDVWLDTANPLFAERISETVQWLLRDMRAQGDDSGIFAFVSAFDADSEGVEGKFYVWTEDEIDAILGSHSDIFKPAYDVTRGGNWEGVTILNRTGTAAFGSREHEDTLARCREKLLDVRASRVPPQRDDKVLADWNGMLIAALAKAAAVFDRSEWLDAAKTAFSFVTAHMRDHNRLHHVWCAGHARHPAVIDDYANMARAALTLFEITGEATYLAHARTWVAIADRHYWDAQGSGYFLSADDTKDVISRCKNVSDNATPSGNGMMLEVLARLYGHTGAASYRHRAEALALAFSGDNPNYLLSVPGLLAAYEYLANPVQIAILGQPGDPLAREMRDAALRAPVPCKVIAVIPPGETLPDHHPAAGKTQVESRTTAYVCAGPRCGLPVTSVPDLRHQLSSL